MGQYYKPVNLDTKQWLYSHDYDNGLKLMEHSYVGNVFVGAVLALLRPGKPWYKGRIVWAGDYGSKTVADFTLFGDDAVQRVADKLEGDEENVYTKIGDKMDKKLQPRAVQVDQSTTILCNHDKKLFVDYHLFCPNGMDINPLPLLTADGNGNGWGDYVGTNEALVGTWAGDHLSVEREAPPGFTELVPGFEDGDP